MGVKGDRSGRYRFYFIGLKAPK
ncbi:uncharacterized protein G2W53_017063 [Senna tora]|uniref:Uncharacterized protein n=1 Tax=Senna tora TaxID=362788 RepID=A0A834TXM7_9FABA|nr:uncharacterized protein G2W53_017063 [Senna tora]